MNAMKKILLGAILMGLVLGLAIAPAVAATLWYNGDLDYNSLLANSINVDPSQSPAAVYDDFIVPSGPGWHITTVWSNNCLYGDPVIPVITSAYWEIRSGVSAGNGGTLVASGTGPATPTATGNNFYGLDEYTIKVTGLDATLTPGTYWLSVSPIGTGSGYSWITTTSGANAVGQPPGNDGNSYFNSITFGANFDPASTWIAYSPADFSMGVGGNPVPVPASVWLLGSGLVGLWYWRRRKA